MMVNTHDTQPNEYLIELYASALVAVEGETAVERELLKHPISGNVSIIAVGKAAASMMRGASKVLKDQIQSALIITKEGYADTHSPWPCIEAGHPIPNQQSLIAGTKLLEFIKSIPIEHHVITLVSGGTSALVEVLPKGMELQQLQKMNDWLLSSGLAIAEINRIRQAVSMIKAGKILAAFSTHSITQLLISDVEGDYIDIIGSGLFVEDVTPQTLAVVPGWLKKYLHQAAPVSVNVKVESSIVASNKTMCQAIIDKTQQSKSIVHDHGQTLFGDVFQLAKTISLELKTAAAGIHIWGGEPTIELPESPGRGGRNQSLALALACEIDGYENITVLVAATDGSDGPGDDVGAIVDGKTIQQNEQYTDEAKESLKAADAGQFLAKAGVLISTGPTGTNVMDVVIAVVK